MTPTPSSSGEAWWILPLVLAGFPFFWLAMMFLVSRLGGWAALAKACPAKRRPRGPEFRGLSLQIGPATSYGGCITAIFSPDGLYLVPLVIFRFGHRPLLIPWEQVGASVERKLLWVRFVYLPLTVRGRSARLRLSRKAQDWLQGGESTADWRPKLAPAPDAGAPRSPFQRNSSWRGR